MSFTKTAFKLMVDAFIKMGKRPYGKLLTLSRYYIDFTPELLNSICHKAGWDVAVNEKDDIFNDETVFNALGFEHLDSIDISSFEGANIICDLNKPIPDKMKNQYDFILDCGTIEHVFNTKIVLKNIFDMLKVGGVFFFEQMTFYGINHGYYNFSLNMLHDYFQINNYIINTFIPYTFKDRLIYILDPDVNDIFADIPILDNSKNSVCGSVVKTQMTTYDQIPYQGHYLSAWESSPAKQIYELLEQAESYSVFFYGTGNYIRFLLQAVSPAHKEKIIGLLSNEACEIGTKLYGFRIFSIDEITDKCKAIIIASINQYRQIIYDRIKFLEEKGIKVIRFQ